MSESERQTKIKAAREIIALQTERRDAATDVDEYLAFNGDILLWQGILARPEGQD